MPVAAIVSQIEAGLVAQGHADDDMSDVARTIRGLLAASRLPSAAGRAIRVQASPGNPWFPTLVTARPEQEHRLAQPPVVARPEPLAVVHPLDVHARAAPRAVGQ